MSTTELEQLLLEVADRGATFRLTPEGKLSVFPRRRLGKGLLKRIKKHKNAIVEILQAGEEIAGGEVDTVVIPRCLACGELIPRDEPHISLENFESGREHPYHANFECQKSALGWFAERIGSGEIYVLHHVHVCGDEASGFGCAGGCFREAVSEVEA